MRITTPEEIRDIAWEGPLEPLGERFAAGAAAPRVTLGEPTVWSADALAAESGRPWSPPTRGRYMLLRLACTLHPAADGRTQYLEATLAVSLGSEDGHGPVLAHDLYPQRLGVDRTGKLTVGLKGDLKFAGLVEAGTPELGAEIEYRKTFPVIQAFGLGESKPYWQFSAHPAYPLLGCQHVYLVASAPPQASRLRLKLELSATVDTRFGPFRLGLPESLHGSIRRTLDL